MSLQLKTCPSCHAQFEPRGSRPRCPVCGARFGDVALPAPTAPEDEDPSLEIPANLLEDAPEEQTSILEVSAALVCFTGIAIFVAGFLLASPAAFIGGFLIVFVVIAVVCIHSWWVKARDLWDREGRR
jgi:hypothetical protein